jgi:hypothetical protein
MIQRLFIVLVNDIRNILNSELGDNKYGSFGPFFFFKHSSCSFGWVIILNIYYILYITILNISIYKYKYINKYIFIYIIYINIYTSLYEPIHELSRVEPSLLRLLFEPRIGVHEALHLIFESSSSRAYTSRARACSRSASLI